MLGSGESRGWQCATSSTWTPETVTRNSTPAAMNAPRPASAPLRRGRSFLTISRSAKNSAEPQGHSGTLPLRHGAETDALLLVDILHAINGVDSYGAMAVSHGRFGGFLLHRSASLRRISTGFTLGSSGPRSMFQDAENF